MTEYIHLGFKLTPPMARFLIRTMSVVIKCGLTCSVEDFFSTCMTGLRAGVGHVEFVDFTLSSARPPVAILVLVLTVV